MRTRLPIALFVTIGCGVAAAEDADREVIPQALQNYVSRPEPAFAWKHRNTRQLPSGTVYDVELVSQKWQTITWKHTLHVYEPKQVRHKRHVLLFVTGGSNGRQPGRDRIDMGLKLARLAGARVAMLYQVPNQPLLGGRKEDDLITETWLRYLKTGDPNWPLLFPMVKSAVKAMDAIEDIAKSQWNDAVDGFVVTGASKRGWTSWLTAVADKRVLAIAPIVIDVLNFQPQMKHQLDTWGKYSEQIIDYTSKGLIKLEGEETPQDIRLRRMMDPYTYRRQLELPKLLINGTNDRYWVLDAMNLYWDGLVGPKHVLYVPNAGHGLGDGQEAALSTLAAFFRHTVTNRPLPELRWKHSDADNSLRLTITSSRKPTAARLWTAHSPTKDFREAKWQASPLAQTDGRFVGELPKPNRGHVALFGELEFDDAGLSYRLSTQIRRQ